MNIVTTRMRDLYISFYKSPQSALQKAVNLEDKRAPWVYFFLKVILLSICSISMLGKKYGILLAGSWILVLLFKPLLFFFIAHLRENKAPMADYFAVSWTKSIFSHVLLLLSSICFAINLNAVKSLGIVLMLTMLISEILFSVMAMIIICNNNLNEGVIVCIISFTMIFVVAFLLFNMLLVSGVIYVLSSKYPFGVYEVLIDLLGMLYRS